MMATPPRNSEQESPAETVFAVKVYEDAFDESPTKERQYESLLNALAEVVTQASLLPAESDSEFKFGEGGDSELFEVYPKPGRGTVVVEKKPRNKATLSFQDGSSAAFTDLVTDTLETSNYLSVEQNGENYTVEETA